MRQLCVASKYQTLPRVIDFSIVGWGGGGGLILSLCISKRVLQGGGREKHQFYFSAYISSKPLFHCFSPILTGRIQKTTPVHTISFRFPSAKLRLLNATQQGPKYLPGFAKIFWRRSDSFRLYKNVQVGKLSLTTLSWSYYALRSTT